MVFSGAFFAILSLGSTALGVPWDQTAKYASHRARSVGDTAFESYYPDSIYETYGDGIDHPPTPNGELDLKSLAMAFWETKLNLDARNISYLQGYTGDTAQYAYAQQVVNGLPLANCAANVAFTLDNKVAAFGSSFVTPPDIIPSPDPTISLSAAILTAELALNGTHNNFPPSTYYLLVSARTLALTFAIQIQNKVQGIWVEVFVDAHSGALVGITDFTSKADYRVLPITKETPPEGFETLVNPQNTQASLLGWLDDGSGGKNNTAGNNAISRYEGNADGTAYQTSSNPSFTYMQDPTQQPAVPNNMKAAIVNAFYIVNTVHDISYIYGFTEKAFNFQSNNFGKGGKENDRITISVQDKGGMDNADFASPPDGQNGHMRMFLWDYTIPGRDGALENSIVVHENTHGITNRMTGGGTGRCLQTTEAGGLGEGWSDAMAEWTEQKNAIVSDYVIGQYVTNRTGGIRSYPYSTSASTNPLRYSSLKNRREVHDIGEVWANMLHNVYAALLSVNGFSPTAQVNSTGTAGNVIYLHLFMDALALQPCNPTFVTARDAWIQADANRFGGKNKCVVYRAFASRGLGVGAKKYVDNPSVPPGC